MPQKNDLSRSLVAFEQDRTLVVVLEISLSTWLVAGLLPGVARQPAKKLGADEHELLKVIHRWRAEAARSGREIDRICVAFEAGRDGFWLARKRHGGLRHSLGERRRLPRAPAREDRSTQGRGTSGWGSHG